MSKTEFLGVDIGGVIISRTKSEECAESSYQNIPDVFESLRELVEKRFGDKICIISKARQSTQDKMLVWFGKHNFFDRTGVKPANVYFCRERCEKADICTKFGVTHFVDDRLEVLGYLATAGIKNLYLFQGRKHEIMKNIHFLSHVHRVESWHEILSELLKKSN